MTSHARAWKLALQRTFAGRADHGFRFSGAPGARLGLETRTVPAEYRWDGRRRGAKPDFPWITFQATLDGRGTFEQGGRRWSVGPGKAFFSVIPSAHVYYLPQRSASWTFFWFHFSHPYIVARLAALAQRFPPVFALGEGSDLLAQSTALFERICRQRFKDAYDEEAALFEWLLSFEKHLHGIAYPLARRRGLLEELREYTLANLKRSFGIDEIARRAGLSRSHYCHRFKAATGLTPAAHVLDVRLTEARRHLRETSAPLKEIAAATGFADANHLCKAFRRHYHLSPGAYRGQTG